MKKNAWRILLVIVVITAPFFVGCTRQNTAIPPTILSSKASIGLICVSTVTDGISRDNVNNAKFYQPDNRIGNVLIAEATNAGFLKAVRSVTMDIPKSLYLTKYASMFEAKGWSVKFLQESEFNSNFKISDEPTDKKFPIDVSRFEKEQNLDYILFLNVAAFGATQDYDIITRLIPMGPPKGTSRVDVIMVDTRTNLIVSEWHSSTTTPAPSDWNEPPLYPKLAETIRGTLKSAVETAQIGLLVEPTTGAKQ